MSKPRRSVLTLHRRRLKAERAAVLKAAAARPKSISEKVAETLRKS